MDFNSFWKSFHIVIDIATIICIVFDVLLVNYNFFNFLENDDVLKVIHGINLFFFIWRCLSEFTQEYTISSLVSLFAFYDNKIISLATDRYNITDEGNPLWTQHFFFFSVFVTPIFSRTIMVNDYPIYQLILFGILMIILSSLSIFSLYTTFIPQAIVLCTLVSKFIHVDSLKSHRFAKKNLLIAFKILLFLIICELFYPMYTDIFDYLHENEYCSKVIEYLTGHPFTDFPTKTLVSSNNLNYLDRFGQFFSNNDECQITLILYFLTSILYKKINQHYENYFVIISILSLLVPSYEDPYNGNALEIHFFIFKTYLLIAFGIACSRLKPNRLIIILSLFFLILASRQYENEFYSKLSEISEYICNLFNL